MSTNPTAHLPSLGLATLDEVLQHQLADLPADVSQSLRETVDVFAQAAARIAAVAAQGPLADAHGVAGGFNSQGDAQQKLDLIADERIARALSRCEHVAAWASEEHEHIRVPDRRLLDEALLGAQNRSTQGRLLVVYDPLDGSSNIDPNLSVGTIFSILPHPYLGTSPGDAGFMQPGHQQLAAGYVLYGPATLLVLTVRRGVMVFTLDRRSASHGQPRWVLTQDQVRIPTHTREFAINASNQRFWEKPVQRYVAECVAGEGGPRMKDFNMRWVASMVADVHRIMTRGGVFMYPRDNREPDKPGKLRLMYEANPMAFVIEQAGGAATDGAQRILDIQPEKLHQRVAVFLGSRNEVERATAYHLG